MIGQLARVTRDVMLPVAGRLTPGPLADARPVTIVLQPDHLGDILLSQPAVTLLRESFPDDRLVGLVGPWSAEAARLAWPVDEVVEVAYPGFTRDRTPSHWQPYRLLRSERERLLPLRAARAVVLRPDAWWAAWLGRLIAPVVVGSDDRRVASFATSVVSVVDDGHASNRAYQVAALAAGHRSTATTWDERPLNVPVSSSDRDVEEVFQNHGIVGPFAVIHPGSGAPVKEWPEHRWRAVGTALRNDELTVVITGSSSERDMAERIVSGLDGAVSIAGKTDVRMLAAVLSRASIVVGCDSGPMHLAVATGSPTVHLFGPSDPNRYGPWGTPLKHRVVHAGWSCPRCGDLSMSRPQGCGCMLAIQTEHVIATMRELLHASRS